MEREKLDEMITMMNEIDEHWKIIKKGTTIKGLLSQDKWRLMRMDLLLRTLKMSEKKY